MPGMRLSIRGHSAAVALRLRRPSRSRAGTWARARRDRRRRGHALALCGGAGAQRAALRLPRRGLDPARPAPLARRRDLFQARLADADRVVQGPRHRGHDQSPDRGRDRPDPRRFLGQCRRLARRLRRRRRHPVPDLCPGGGTARQAGADRRVGRRSPRRPRHPPGGVRGGARRRRRELLRQP